MEDLSQLLPHERAERQDATEGLVVALLGQFLFRYSDFVTALHFCNAWHDWGSNLDNYGSIANDLGTATLLSRIEKQVHLKYGKEKKVRDLYLRWLKKAHSLRETRNILVHARWTIEYCGRFAIATTTPVFVEPQVEHKYYAEDLCKLKDSIHPLISELNNLRHTHYL